MISFYQILQIRAHRKSKYWLIGNRSLVGYTGEERLIGDAATNQIKKNYLNTIQFFTRFLGLNSDCADQIKEEEKYITYKIAPFENKRIGIQV